MKKKYYIAYGSNLNVSQMRFRCPEVRPVGKGELHDWRLLFKGSRTGAYLTIEKKPGYSVPVGIWEVTNKDEKRLDRYEGYPVFYRKEKMLINVRDLSDGKTRLRECFVYIMDEKRQVTAPSPFYLFTCMDGYDDFGLDQKILQKAYEESGGKYDETVRRH